jgi:hypothetical protein
MPSALLSSIKDQKMAEDNSELNSNDSQGKAWPLKDNAEVSPAPVSRFTPRGVVN